MQNCDGKIKKKISTIFTGFRIELSTDIYIYISLYILIYICLFRKIFILVEFENNFLNG